MKEQSDTSINKTDPVKKHSVTDSKQREKQQEAINICELTTSSIQNRSSDDIRCNDDDNNDDDDSIIDDQQYIEILENEWKQLRIKVIEMKQQKLNGLVKIEGLLTEHNVLQQRKNKMIQKKS